MLPSTTAAKPGPHKGAGLAVFDKVLNIMLVTACALYAVPFVAVIVSFFV